MSLGTVVTYGKNTVDENMLWILLAVFIKVELYTRVGLENQKLTNRLGLSKVDCLWIYFPNNICFQPQSKVFKPLGWHLKTNGLCSR